MEDKEGEKKDSSRIGREGEGVLGKNWNESQEAARKGRYAEENKVQGDDPDHQVDTDVSQAV